MRTDHAAMRGGHGAAHDLGRVGLKIMKPVLFAGCLIVSLPLTSTTATAHVKWFVNCNVSDDPLPVQAIFTATFLLFFTLFLIVLYLGCTAEPARVHGHVLSLTSIQRMLSQLASTPLSERIEIPGMHPDRAPTIVAGVVILVETIRAFGLDQIEVSEHDILYGTAISAASDRN